MYKYPGMLGYDVRANSPVSRERRDGYRIGAIVTLRLSISRSACDLRAPEHLTYINYFMAWVSMMCSSLTQLVECATLNRLVMGSSPIRGI
eukprot:scaffold148278_cov33-Tisochrysis_lutea.AAC.1